MASKAVNVFLNAYDNTASATSTAAANVASYADSVVASNQVAAGSFDQVGVAAEQSMLASLGAIVAESFQVVAAVAAIAAVGYVVYRNWEVIGATVTEALSQIVDGTFNWRQAFVSASEVVVTALAAIEGSIRNWGDLASYVGLSAAYEVIKFANVVEYYFTSVIPQWVVWLGETWIDVFMSLGNNLATLVDNMWENIKAFFEAVWNYLSGNAVDFQWTALTEGFELSLKQLPVIAERELGALEKQMGVDLDIIGGRLGEGVQDNINKRLGQFQSSFGGKGAGGIFDKVKDFASSFSFGGFGGFGGGKGGGGQITGPEGESSRFLTGVSASSQEKIMLDQLAMQKELTETQKQTNELTRAIKQIISGNITGLLTDLAAKQGSQIILTD